jgi:hypothetical protein
MRWLNSIVSFLGCIIYIAFAQPASATDDVASLLARIKKLVNVMIWFDVARGVGVKQVFDEGQGMHRECLYNNIEINAHLPPDAFRQR